MQNNQMLIADLNPAQREAVLSPPGPLLIIAGAGSGKTRVLVHRIANFIASGIDPAHILAITFTNKAADEMRNRVSHLIYNPSSPPLNVRGGWVGLLDPRVKSRLKSRILDASGPEDDKRSPFIGTFHALALRILREDASRIDVPRDFVIADDADSTSIMKRVMKQLKISPETVAPSEALGRISQEKGELRDFSMMRCQNKIDEIVRTLYEAYQQTLLREKLLDFDDLLFFAVKLLESQKDILEKYRRRFKHILVDEYQDTNTAQYTLVKLLAKGRDSITAVGDDYQAIYGWRGADFRNILNFRDDWPNAKIIKLEQNYRSTQTILDAADGVIKKVAARTEKTLVATKPLGSNLVMSCLADDEEEALYVIDTLRTLSRQGQKIGDAVVLYRTNAQSRPFEELCIEKRIPYRIIGGLRFYERREVKDVLAYLRYLANERDLTSLSRIINVPPRGVGKVGLLRIAKEGLDAVAASSVPARDFHKLLSTLREKQSGLMLSQFVKELVRVINYRQYLREAFAAKRTWRADDSEERWENIEELVQIARRYDTLTPAEALQRFLENVSLFSQTDAMSDDTNTLNLMTMHLAKGLEFPTVFIAGCEEGLLPHARSVANPEALDEERRLCYVAMTRAKDRVYLTYARRRGLHGEYTRRMPSRFLSDIPQHLVEFHGTSLVDLEDDEFEIVEE